MTTAVKNNIYCTGNLVVNGNLEVFGDLKVHGATLICSDSKVEKNKVTSDRICQELQEYARDNYSNKLDAFISCYYIDNDFVISIFTTHGTFTEKVTNLNDKGNLVIFGHYPIYIMSMIIRFYENQKEL